MRHAHTKTISLDDITKRVGLLRGQRVLLDADLAELYGVSTKRLNEQLSRNRKRFPPDFVFRLADHEVRNLRSHFATSSLAGSAWGGRRYAPFAFTEHGALMAANVLSSARAVSVSIFVVRAFIRLRETLAANRELAKKLDELERKTESLATKHDALAEDTRVQFRQVIEALRSLMSSPAPRRRPIGFVTSQ